VHVDHLLAMLTGKAFSKSANSAIARKGLKLFRPVIGAAAMKA